VSRPLCVSTGIWFKGVYDESGSVVPGLLPGAVMGVPQFYTKSLSARYFSRVGVASSNRSHLKTRQRWGITSSVTIRYRLGFTWSWASYYQSQMLFVIMVLKPLCASHRQYPVVDTGHSNGYGLIQLLLNRPVSIGWSINLGGLSCTPVLEQREGHRPARAVTARDTTNTGV